MTDLMTVINRSTHAFALIPVLNAFEKLDLNEKESQTSKILIRYGLDFYIMHIQNEDFLFKLNEKDHRTVTQTSDSTKITEHTPATAIIKHLNAISHQVINNKITVLTALKELNQFFEPLNEYFQNQVTIRSEYQNPKNLANQLPHTRNTHK